MTTSFLFVSDLDNTLVGDDAALQVLNNRLVRQREQNGTKIVYATGRSLTLYRRLTTEKPILPPDALICAVGTEIYFNPDDGTFDPEWAELVSLGWDREKVVATTAHYSDLIPQPDTEQGRFKASYFLSEEMAGDLIPRLEAALVDQGLEIKIIYSGSQDLDILPRRSDKGLAVRHLQQKWGMDDQQTVVCGDSGNDIALFSVGQSRGVIVGNARPELRQWYEQNATDYRYFAQATCAGGILEGLKHFGLIEG